MNVEAYFVVKGKSKGKKGANKAMAPLQTSTSLCRSSPHFCLYQFRIRRQQRCSSSRRRSEDEKAWFVANQANATAEAIAKAHRTPSLTNGKRLAVE